MQKKLLSLSLIISFLFSATAFANTTNEADEAKNFLIEKGATTRIKYKPSNPIDRITLVKWTLTTLGYTPEAKDLNQTRTCQDSRTDEEDAFLRKATEINSISFTPLNPFCKPTKKPSRLEAIKQTLITFGVPVPKVTTQELDFKDIAESAWFIPWIAKTVELDLMEPSSPDFFRPFANITQEQAALLIYKTHKHAFQTPQDSEPPIEIVLSGDQIPHSDVLYDVWETILTDYYYIDESGHDEDTLAYEAIKGMVNSLNDPFSMFESPLDEQTEIEILRGEFGGIGAHLQDENGQVVIINVFQDSPAERAGLKVNDIIINVDNQSTEDLTAETVADLIRGAAGTSVKVRIRRDDKIILYTVTREIIEITYVEGGILEDDIAYISISIFGEETDEDFEEMLEAALAEKPTGFIIDLRNNPGGYVQSTGLILNHFVPRGETVMYLKDVNDIYTQVTSEGPGEISEYPLTVLINEGSASAAEIFAGAVQDLDLGKIVGTTSYGKGTAQELIEYNDGSILKLTAAEWLTPNRKSINHIGITPDIEVAITQEDIDNEEDPQLERAMEEINSK